MTYEEKLLRRKNRIKGSKTDIIYYVVISIILLMLLVIVAYPIYFILIASFSDPDAVMNGEVLFFPVGLTVNGYKKLMGESLFWRGYLNTLIYTFLGTVFNLILTIPAGWALSRNYLPCRKLINTILIITMFFGGGLIPYFLLVSKLGLVNNPLILIIGGGVSVYNVFMCKSYFTLNIPKEIL